jgi:hypothetical protein
MSNAPSDHDARDFLFEPSEILEGFLELVKLAQN